ncbi:transglutaminase TgpA family protein [Chondromyces apiculatus]|uniref:Transglutaminase-like enzyme n=1 Tax=Chondromyces apiculatus DSM 436 TaxID=1192034 RepID=A0A017TD97_9BACT|nr:transglutaminaseTgpA domain-containing protein [Chondromyces apiculatus]EYF06536.1 Transglutaminase-like enzyme [Chondromyces apiculatus DSM 436]
MRFGIVHRIMTDALAALGVIALVMSGSFNRFVSWAILIGLALALMVRESWQRHPALRHLDTGALLFVVAAQIVRVIFTDASVLDVLVEFAAALQVIRLATRKGAAHDQQVIVLALLHLIAGTVLGGGLGYGLCFLGVLIVAPGALVLSHLRREVEGNYRQGARDRTGLPVDVPRILRSRRVVGRSFIAVTCLLSIPIFAFTAVLFAIFPRVGLSLLLLNRGNTPRMIGFSGKVDLGVVGVLRSDPKLAMRVEVPGLPEPPPPRVTLHLRGTALDAYDGRSWSQSEVFRRPAEIDAGLVPLERYPDPATEASLRIDLEPIDPPVIFLPPHATGLRIKPRAQPGMEPGTTAFRGPEGEFRYQPIDDRGLVYEVFLSRRKTATFQRLPSSERRRYLQLPKDIPPRIADLARDWAGSAEQPAEKARAIEARLRSDYRYDLASPSGKDPQPLDHFLFESKRGHCEFYSTAMAVMLRTLDVPTRNVTGFVGGTWNRFGRFYAVRQGDAHSWVEVFLDGEGWVTFDPTPPADAAPKSEVQGAWAYLRDLIEATSQRWDRHIVGYDRTQQVSLFQALTSRYRRGGGGATAGWSRSPVLLVAGVAFAVAGAVLYWRWRKGRGGRGSEGPSDQRSPSAILATSLYESLDAAMNVQGIPRAPGIPPLRHAELLQALDHPLADEVASLTAIYLRARFGGQQITEPEARIYEQRVKAIRVAELKDPHAADPIAAT